MSLLANVTAADAAAHPVAGVHSIWELVLHMAVCKRVVRRRLAGERINDLPPDEDWPSVTDTSEAAWRHHAGQVAIVKRALTHG